MACKFIQSFADVPSGQVQGGFGRYTALTLDNLIQTRAGPTELLGECRLGDAGGLKELLQEDLAGMERILGLLHNNVMGLPMVPSLLERAGTVWGCEIGKVVVQVGVTNEGIISLLIPCSEICAGGKPML